VKVRIKLFGTLGLRLPNYNHDQGVEMELPDGAKVEDLLARLEIKKSEKVLVTIDGTVQKADSWIKHRSNVYVFSIAGGG
jgi:sulfur carrier protein ThiS